MTPTDAEGREGTVTNLDDTTRAAMEKAIYEARSQAEDQIELEKILFLAGVNHARSENERLREALGFYANERRYAYDEDCCFGTYLTGPHPDPQGPEEAAGVIEDAGAIARQALSHNRETP